jgi:hypothetical protein
MADEITKDLHRYLRESREALLDRLDGLSEYDIRRPMTPTATNLLGLVKHLVGIEFGYLGDCVGRPAPVSLPWNEDGSVWEGADMWAKPDESRDYIVGLYHRAWQHADESIEQLGLGAPASVSWWPEDRRQTTLGSLLVRTLTDTAQHAGQADIIREMIDGRGGKDRDDMGGEQWWTDYRKQVQEAAEHHR